MLGLTVKVLANLRTAKVIKRRVVPVITMLMPTSVPMTHNDATGH